MHHSLGSKVMRPCRQEDEARAKEGESSNEREETRRKKRDNAAPNIIMQWTGSANGGGARYLFVIFSL